MSLTPEQRILVSGNLQVARLAAKRSCYLDHSLARDEILQVAQLALVDAVRNYKPDEFLVPFPGFARKYVEG